MDIDTQLETKAGLPPDSLVTHGEMMRVFEHFKEANDERLAGLKRGGDVLLEEKVARINDTVDAHQRRLEEMTVKSGRPPLASERSANTVGAREHKAAFESYVRSGESAGLRALETKAMSVGSAPDGGYLVPDEVETQIGERLTLISPIRSIAGVREISGNVYKKRVMTAGPAVGWAGETDARSQTTSPTLAELTFPAMELYAMPAATATLLEDSAVNIDQWIAAEVEQVFAAQEGAAFVNGDGTNKPMGFLQYTTIAEASWAWTKIGYVASGAAGAFDADAPVDAITDLVYALEVGYRQNGTRRRRSRHRLFAWLGRQLRIARCRLGKRVHRGPASVLPLPNAQDHSQYVGPFFPWIHLTSAASELSCGRPGAPLNQRKPQKGLSRPWVGKCTWRPATGAQLPTGIFSRMSSSVAGPKPFTSARSSIVRKRPFCFR
jgi:HK97 family phage major capsid protein